MRGKLGNGLRGSQGRSKNFSIRPAARPIVALAYHAPAQLLSDCPTASGLQMDIDTVIQELNGIVRFRGSGGLTEATVRAPKLLRLARYKQAEDPHALLAEDIKLAITRLPETLQIHATGLLPIDHPDLHINGRLKNLGLSGYSGDAERWHRTAVLGRVAAELAALHAAQTAPDQDKADGARAFRIKELHISVELLPPERNPSSHHPRILSFQWLIESSITDLQHFSFRYNLGPTAELHYWESDSEVVRPSVLEPMTIPTTEGDHRLYTVYFAKPPTRGSSFQLEAQLHYQVLEPSPHVLGYILPAPVDDFALSVFVSRKDFDHVFNYCEREPGIYQEIDKGELSPKDRSLSPGPDYPVWCQYIPSSPRQGRLYEIGWEVDQNY
jgi:hypothetical protein